MAVPKIQGGYILFARIMQESSVWRLSPDHTRLALYLLMQVQHKKKPFTLSDGTILSRGSGAFSMAIIAEECAYFDNRKERKWSRQKVARMLSDLESVEYLKYKSDKLGTLITLCNYELYQEPSNYKSDILGQPPTNPQPTPNQPPTTNKKGNNVENENKKKTSRFAPPSLLEIKEYVNDYSESCGKEKIDAEAFLNFYESKGWMVGRNKMKEWKAAVRTWFKDQPELTSAQDGPSGVFL